MQEYIDSQRASLLIAVLSIPLWAGAADLAPAGSAPTTAPATALTMATTPTAATAAPAATAAVTLDAPAPAADTGDAPQAGTAPFGLAHLGPAANAAQLERSRGGAATNATIDTITTSASLEGSVSGNSASQMATGANRIDSGSFAGAVGLPVVIQNSGANVLIQNATVINLQLK